MCLVCFESRWCTGVYGNVLRIKILFNKKDSALVEYTEPDMADHGSVNLLASVLLL